MSLWMIWQHPPSSKYWKKPNAQSECFTCVHRLITEECNHTTDWLWGRLDWFKDTLISKKRNLLQLKGNREREREVETYRGEARQKRQQCYNVKAVWLPLRECKMHRAMVGCYSKHQWERGNGENCGEIVCLFTLSSTAPVINSDADGHSFFFRAPISKHPFILKHPTPSSDLYSAQCTYGTTALRYHPTILWGETWKLCLMPFNHVLFLQPFQVPSVVFQLHSSSSSSQTPALLALKRNVLLCTHVSQFFFYDVI